MMSAEKNGTPYAEPPPPYTSAPPGAQYPPQGAPYVTPQSAPYPSPGHYGPGVAAGRNIFQGPMHPPPPGGVPVFPMSGGGYKPPSAQTVVMNTPTGQPVQAVTVVNVAQVGPYPMQVTCPHCHAHVMSETVALPGLLTWLLSAGLFLLGCWAGCCLIPCCVPECQDIEHRCPSCKQHLGTFRRI